MQLVRETIVKLTGTEPPPLPPAPRVTSYGEVAMESIAPLFAHLGELYPGDGIYSRLPEIMEEYGQFGGVILYRTQLPEDLLCGDAVLNVGGAVHDYAKVRWISGILASRPSGDVHSCGQGMWNACLCRMWASKAASRMCASTAESLLAVACNRHMFIATHHGRPGSADCNLGLVYQTASPTIKGRLVQICMVEGIFPLWRLLVPVSQPHSG